MAAENTTEQMPFNLILEDAADLCVMFGILDDG
jgi:hypothetical protein